MSNREIRHEDIFNHQEYQTDVYRLDWKIRFFDVVLSLIFLLLSFPIMVLIAIAIKLDDGGSIFFCQERLGKGYRNFKMIKFRTMKEDAEANGPRWAMKDGLDSRLTRVGYILRKYRLDELPQFFNVLKGDMSLVGPRPIREYFAKKLAMENASYNQRFRVDQGLTGFAQIYAPYGSTIEEQLEKIPYDQMHLKERGLTAYFKVLLLTVRVVLFGKGR